MGDDKEGILGSSQSLDQELLTKDKRSMMDRLKHCKACSSIPKRYILSVAAMLGFCNLYCMRVNLSVAIVAMVKNHTKTESVFVNSTEVTEEAEFDWSPQKQGILLGAFFWGYAVTQLPGGWLANRIGGKHLLGMGVLCTAVLTIITPLAARISFWVIMIVRILEGLCEGVTYPCMHTLWSKWAPPLERSRLATISLSGSYAGTMISLPLSGLIAVTLGWPWIFYIFGVIAIVWYGLWCWMVTESPEDHPSISNEELEHITGSIGFSYMQTKGVRIPWKSILTSIPFWAITVAHLAENWGFYTLLTELPTFLSSMMNYDLYQAGIMAALPYLVMVIMIQVGGQIADCVRSREIMSTTAIRKTLNCTAFIGQAIFMVITAYMMTPAAAVTCLILAVGVGGLAWAGFSVNMLDIAPQYAGIIMGLSNTFASIPGIIAPALAGHIVQHQTADEWRVVFYISASIYLVGAVFYGACASGKVQPWAEIHFDTTSAEGSGERRLIRPDTTVEYDSTKECLK